LNTTHQLLVYADNVKLLGENINITKKNKEALLVTGEEVSQQVNVQEPKYMFMSCE
jgi:predicted nucleic-acid-binding Zn-ribbon protein